MDDKKPPVNPAIGAAREPLGHRPFGGQVPPESRDFLQAVLDTIPVRLFWKDRDLRYLGCNHLVVLDAGASSPEEIIGTDDYQQSWREQAELYRSDDRKVLESGEARLNYEEPQTTPDGRRIWLRTNKVPLRLSDGTIWGVLGTYEDITERKQAEQALRDSEERYRRLVEVSPVAMWINKGGLITYMNPAALRILGATHLEQVLGRPALDFIHPGYALVNERIHQMVDEGQVAPLVEEKYVRLDGKVIDVEVIATPFGTSEGRAMQVLFQDITRRKQAEAEREALIADLEAKNAALERFAYAVSHDLKSPLVTIRAFIDQIALDLAAGNQERARLDIERISSAAARMTQLLKGSLDLSRAGRVVTSGEGLQFDELVREAMEIVQGQLAARRVTVDLEPDLPAVFGDRQRLVEVLQNLLDNSGKYMGDQADPRIEIGQRPDEDGRPVFYVKDNGIGIPPPHHARVFDLFAKLDPGTEGAGVGLALVKRIVEGHGGRVWVESEGERGTTFCFTLGARKPQ